MRLPLALASAHKRPSIETVTYRDTNGSKLKASPTPTQVASAGLVFVKSAEALETLIRSPPHQGMYSCIIAFAIHYSCHVSLWLTDRCTNTL